MKTHLEFKSYSIVVLIVAIISFTGCIELLELGEVEELGAVGVEVEELGTLRIASADLVAEEISGVKMFEEGELSIMKNGRVSRFAEVIDNNRIVLENGKIVKLPNPLYRVNEDVFVRRSPFRNSSMISSEHYAPGQLVIVNDEINGWYEVMLPNREFGFIPVAALSIAQPSTHRNSYKKESVKRTGYRNGVNYIVNNSFINVPNTKDMIVNITFSDGSFDETSSIKLSSIASDKGYHSTPSFFSKYYYIDELSKQLKLGNLDYINKMKLYNHADYLLIGEYSVKIRLNQLRNDMLTSDFTYNLSMINLKNGNIEKNFSNTIYGNGWTDSQARNDALQAFYQIIKQAKF
jgi:hypothetical protein